MSTSHADAADDDNLLNHMLEWRIEKNQDSNRNGVTSSTSDSSNCSGTLGLVAKCDVPFHDAPLPTEIAARQPSYMEVSSKSPQKITLKMSDSENQKNLDSTSPTSSVVPKHDLDYSPAVERSVALEEKNCPVQAYQDETVKTVSSVCKGAVQGQTNADSTGSKIQVVHGFSVGEEPSDISYEGSTRSKIADVADGPQVAKQSQLHTVHVQKLDTSKINTNLQKIREKIKKMKYQNSAVNTLPSNTSSSEFGRKGECSSSLDGSSEDISCPVESAIQKQNSLVSFVLSSPMSEQQLTCDGNDSLKETQKNLNEDLGCIPCKDIDVTGKNQDCHISMAIDSSGVACSKEQFSEAVGKVGHTSNVVSELRKSIATTEKNFGSDMLEGSVGFVNHSPESEVKQVVETIGAVSGFASDLSIKDGADENVSSDKEYGGTPLVIDTSPCVSAQNVDKQAVETEDECDRACSSDRIEEDKNPDVDAEAEESVSTEQKQTKGEHSDVSASGDDDCVVVEGCTANSSDKGERPTSPATSDHSCSTAPYEEESGEQCADHPPAPSTVSLTASPVIVTTPVLSKQTGPTSQTAQKDADSGGVACTILTTVTNSPAAVVVPAVSATPAFLHHLGLSTKGPRPMQAFSPNISVVQSTPVSILMPVNQPPSPVSQGIQTLVSRSMPVILKTPSHPSTSATGDRTPPMSALGDRTPPITPLAHSSSSTADKSTDVENQEKSTFVTPTTSSPAVMTSPMGHSWKTSPCKGFFICAFQDCEFSSNDANEFRQHNLCSHNHGSTYPCVYCHLRFDNGDALTHHMRQHSTKKLFQTYQCTVCRFSTNLKDVFRHHWITVHKETNNCPCNHCKQSYPNIDQLLEHIQQNLLKLVECPYCHVKSPARSKLLAHISEAHPGQPRKISVSTSVMCKHKVGVDRASTDDHSSPTQSPSPIHGSQVLPSTSILPKPHELTAATSGADYLASLKAKKSKLKNESYQCLYCSYTVAEFQGFVQHVHKHSMRNPVVNYYCCPHCPYITTRKSALVRHVPMKHRDGKQRTILRQFPLDDKVYPCWYCPDYKAPSPGVLHLHYINCINRSRTNTDYEMYQDLRHDEKTLSQSPPKKVLPSSSTNSSSTSHSKPVELNVPVYEPSSIMRFFCMFCKQSYYKLVGLEKHIRNNHLTAFRPKCEFQLSVCPMCQFQSTDPAIVNQHCSQKHWKHGVTFTIDKRVHRIQISSHSGSSSLSSPVTIDRYHCDFCNFSTSGATVLDEHMRLHEIENSTTTSSPVSASRSSNENSQDGSSPIMVHDDKLGEVVNLPYQSIFKTNMNCPQCHNYPTRVRSNLIRHLKTCQKLDSTASKSSTLSSHLSPRSPCVWPHTQDTNPVSVTDSGRLKDKANVSGEVTPLDLSLSSPPAMDLSVKHVTKSASSVEPKSFKCGYCAYSSDQKYYVQIHCGYEHSDLPEKIESSQSDSEVTATNLTVAPATSSVSPALDDDPPLTLELAAVTSLAVDPGNDNQAVLSKSPVDGDENSLQSEHTVTSGLSQSGSQVNEQDKIKEGLLKLKAKVATAKERHGVDMADLFLVKSEPVDADHDDDDDLAIGSEASDFQTPEPGTLKYRYQCAHCQYESKYSMEMEKHILRVHLGQQPYLCSRCSFGSFIKNKLKHHFRYKHRGQQVSMVDVRASRVVEVKRENGIVVMKAKNEQNILQPAHPYHKHVDESEEKESGCTSADPVERTPETQRTKAKKKTYKCHHCGHSSLYCINDIKKHVIRKHLGQPVYLCPRCEFGADKRIILVKHLAKVHAAHNMSDSEIVDNKEKLITRTIEMEDENLFIVKSKEHVTVLASDPPSTSQVESSIPELVTRQEFACGHCNYQSNVGTSDISRHIIEHHLPVAMFRCKLCSFQCEEEPTIVDHVNEAHEGTPDGYEDTKSRIITKRHVLGEVATYVTKIEDKSEKLHSPTKRKVVYCAHCNYSSPYSVTLKRHMISRHFPGKLFRCNLCDFEVNDRNRIEKHMVKSHPDNTTDFMDGNLRLLMDVVMKGAQRVTQMRVAGTDNDPPVVDKLPPASAKASVLPAADSSDDGGSGPKYVCGICGKTERHKLGLLKRHIVTFHLKTSPFTCDVCSFASNSQGVMLDHMSKHHPTKLTGFSSNLDKIKVAKGLEGSRRVYTGYTDEVDVKLSKFVLPSKAKMSLTPLEDSDGIDPAALAGMPRLYSCGHCNYKSTACLTDVKRHVCKNHLNESTYSCKSCIYSSNKKQDIVSHIVRKHSGCGEEFVYVPAEKLCSSKKVVSGKLVYTVSMKKSSPEDDTQENDSVGSKADSGISSECFTPPRQYRSVERKTSGVPVRNPTMIHCGHCDWSNKYIGDVKRHVITQHLKKLEYMCNLCETYTDAKFKLANHIRSQHPHVQDTASEIVDMKRELSTTTKGNFPICYITERESEMREFPEDVADVVFTPSTLSKVTSSSHDVSAPVVKETSSTVSRSFSCGHCDYVNNSNVRDVMKHILRSHTNTRNMYDCMECDFGCQVRDHMVTHFSSVHPGLDPDLFCDNSSRCVESVDTREGQDIVVVSLRDGEVCLQTDNIDRFKCGYCSYSSRFPKDVERHVCKLHTNSLRCCYCNFKARLKEVMRLHCINKHPDLPADMKTYTAPTVRIPSSTVDGHYTIKTAKSADAISSSVPESTITVRSTKASVAASEDEGTVTAYHCETCGYTRQSRNEVRIHVFMVHLHYRPYKCAHCPYTAIQNTRITLHIRNVHPGKNYRSVLMRNKALEAKAENFIKPVVVPLSKITNLNQRYNLELTDNKASTSGIHKCKYCDYKTQLIGYLRKHIKIHFTFRPFKCGYCDYGEFSKAKIYNHMKCHHKGKPQKVRSFPKPPQSELVLKHSVAPVLPVTPKSKPSVTISPRSNREIRRPSRYLSPEPGEMLNDKYNCRICSDSFTRVNDIENHVMVHLNYKPFSCLYCSYVAITGNKVMDHTEAEHPDEKVTYRYERNDAFEKKVIDNIEYPSKKRRLVPEELPVAEISTRATKRQKREATPGEESSMYQCPYCSLMMDGIVTVKRHMMKHHNYKPFACTICDFSYYLTSVVKRHHQERHNKCPEIHVVIDPDLDFKCMSDVYNICGGNLGKGNRLLSYQDPCVTTDLSCCPVYTPDMFSKKLMLESHDSSAFAIRAKEREYLLKEEEVVKKEVGGERMASDKQQKLDETSSGVVDDGQEDTDQGTGYLENESTKQLEEQNELEEMEGIKAAPLVETPTSTAAISGDTRLHCPLCDFACPRSKAMRYHLMKHKKYQPFVCPHCPCRSAFDLMLRKHIVQHHPHARSKNFIVRRVQSVENWLERELQKMKDRSMALIAGEKQLQLDPGSGTPLLKCYYCQYITHNLTALKLHSSKSHPAKKLRKLEVTNPLVSEQTSDSQQDALKSQSVKKSSMQCKLCIYKSNNFKNLKIHYTRAHPGKPFKIMAASRQHSAPLKRKEVDNTNAEPDGNQAAKVPRLDGPYPPDGANNQIPCGRCTFLARNMLSLKVHTRRVHGNVQFLIGKTVRHQKRASVTSCVKKVKAFMRGSKRMYRCTRCNFTKAESRPVLRHYGRCHEYYNQTVKCGYCGHTAHESYDITVHCKRMHPGKVAKVIRLSQPLPRGDRKNVATGDSSKRDTSQEPIDENEQLSSRESSEDKSIPDIKQEVFDSDEQPLSQPTSPPAFLNCDRCDFCAETEDELTHHILSHTDQTFTCELCEFTSEVRLEYNRHVKTHTDHTPFQCGHCAFTAFSRHSIQQHCRKRHPDSPVIAMELRHPFTSVGKPQPTMQPKVKVSKC